MRFVLGVLIGFGIGVGGAILFAPDKRKTSEWPPRFPGEAKSAANGNDATGVRAVISSVKGRVNEALAEARDARAAAEREMLERYERSVGRKPAE